MTTSTITVQLKDANGNDLTSGGDTVGLATTLGSLGSVTDNSDGTYIATLTSGTATGSATVTGTVNAAAITDNAVVSFIPGPADATQSTITAAPTSIVANGVTTSTITVQLKDANGNNLTSGGDIVGLVTTLGSLGSVTDNSDGTYTATLTSGTVAGSATVTGTVNAAAITDNAVVSFIPGPADATQSTITAAPTSIVANGVTTSTITVQLKDANGNNLTSGGDIVGLVTTLGSLGSVTDNSDGTYTATLTSGTVAGSATVTGTVNAAAITDNAVVSFIPGPADETQSTITAAPTSIVANGVTTSTITVQLKDANGNNLTSGGDIVGLVTTLGSLGSVTDNSDGTYTATLTSGTVTGSATVTGTVNAAAITDNAVVSFIPGPADETQSTITASPTSIVANGVTTSTITVQLKDANGNDLTSGGDTVGLATTLGSLGSVTDNSDGTYTATLTSGTVTGSATVTGTVNAAAITDNAVVSFIPGAADETQSTITAAPTSIYADGIATSTITVQLKDANGNDLTSGGDTVGLATTLGSLGSVTDNSDGTYTATLTSGTTIGTATVTGTVNAAAITDNATVNFTAPPWPDCSYLYRMRLTVTTGAAAVDAGYSASITFDHAGLVAAGPAKSLASGDDVRIYHWNGAAWSEIGRALDPLSSWNNASTKVWFSLVDPIGATSSDANYYLLYGDSTPTAPPDDWANVFLMGDDFNDGTITSELSTSLNGAASYSETGGEAVLSGGAADADAGILVRNTALASDNEFVIRHKFNHVSGDSVACCNPEVKIIGIVESVAQPTVTTSATENGRRRVMVFHRATDNGTNIQYWDTGGNPVHWTGAAWVAGDGVWSTTLALDTYYIFEIFSDGTNFHIDVRNATGTLLTSTTDIAWTSVLDNGGEDYWFYTGDVYTNAYWHDAKSDWLYLRDYVSPEPTSALGSEETNQAYCPAVPDPATSTITALPTSITADGVSTSTITVQLKDGFGNDITTGGDTVTIATNIGSLTGTVIDNGNGTYTETLTSSTVGTATVTGTVNAAPIADNATVDFTADTSAPKMYWTDATAAKIQRSSLDGTSIEDLINTGLINPGGLALDVINFKMYWTDTGSDKIQRANLDGTGIEDLVSPGGLTSLRGIALDVAIGKMYWADAGTNKIHRANLDGTVVEDLVLGLSAPNGLALDLIASKMYWTDQGTQKIQRANLDGTVVEDLVTTGLSLPSNIALDVAAGKMYWTDAGTAKIQRANMADGSVVEDLVTTGLTTPHGIALDVAAGKMYWTDSSSAKIQRANLDGTVVEDLITSGLTDPRSIALDLTPLAPYIWDGGGADANWNTAANWSTDVVPGVADVAIFNSLCAASCAATINVDPNVAGIEVRVGYTGTITQSSGITATVGASGYIQVAGTFSGGDSTIDINGPFTLSGGAFTSTSGTMSISGDMIVSSGTFTHNSGNVTFDTGTHRTVDIGTAILNDVTLAKDTFSVTVTGTMDVNGDLTITTVGSINTGTIGVAGNVITTDTLVLGTGTVLFDGTGAQTLQVDGVGGSGGVPSVQINKTAGTLTIQDTINVSRDWTFTAGTVDAGTSTVAFSSTASPSVTVDSGAMAFNNVTIAKGSFSVTVTGTMDVNGSLTITTVANISTGTIAVAGNVTSTDTGVAGTGTVMLDGTGAQTITAAGGAEFPDGGFTINKASGTATLASDLVLDGPGQPLNVTSGTLDQGATFNLTSGPITVGAAGTLLNLGTGDLTLSGDVANSGLVNLNSNGAACGDADSIQIRSSATPTQRLWSGSGTFTLIDMDAEDQAGSASITVLSGTDTGNNGGNWTFASCGSLLPPDPGTSLISAAPASIPNDDTTTSTITVQLRDAQLVNLATGGDTVVLYTDLGTLSGVTDKTRTVPTRQRSLPPPPAPPQSPAR